MRIISGTLRGRRISLPEGVDTRPTSERVREAVFSTLQGLVELEGAAVLDLYAGSGALGIEALSRGAGCVVFVEANKAVVRALRENLRALGIEGATSTLQGLCEKSLVAARQQLEKRAQGKADLIFADPPYGEGECIALVQLLVKYGVVGPGSLLVFEQERTGKALEPMSSTVLEGLQVDEVKTKVYGGTAVRFLSFAASQPSTTESQEEASRNEESARQERPAEE